MEETTTTSTKKRDRNNPMDSFLASMTFAGTGPTLQRGGCDCDECGSGVPESIVQAIRNHKRNRVELKRTQQRELVARHGPLSVYKLTLPLTAEPLVEFGTTHRLVWIRHLSQVSQITAIGKGILGSQQEEQGRQVLTDWTHNGVYLVPSNGGKAIGWIHTSGNNASNNNREGHNKNNPEKEDNITEKDKDNTTNNGVNVAQGSEKEGGMTKTEQDDSKTEATSTTGGGHAILYICKIPKECLTQDYETSNDNDNDNDPQQPWQEIVRTACQTALDQFENENTDGMGMPYQQLSPANSQLIREALARLE